MDNNDIITAANIILNSKKIIIICGAGISVSSGIPDFRSTIGLYNTLDCNSIGIPSAELLFDSEFFEVDPFPFYKFAQILLPRPDVKPSFSHYFFSYLEKSKKLIRVYTQNIDGLERSAGITRVVECHGSMSKFQCMKCKRKVPLDESLIECIKTGNVGKCYRCYHTLKPCITFFGDSISSEFEKYASKDLTRGCNLIIVTGTSLQVKGSVFHLLERFDDVSDKKICKILINKDSLASNKNVSSVSFDLKLIGDCDDIFSRIADTLNWTNNISNNMVKSQDSIGSSLVDSKLIVDKPVVTYKKIKALDRELSDESCKKVLETHNDNNCKSRRKKIKTEENNI
jgi:NAD-dependent SIR2 family protein deacetylase